MASISRWQLRSSTTHLPSSGDDREDYGEDRFILIGTAESTVLTVIYTERNGRNRIISARQATKHEKDNYFIENS
jgi:uncharacterized protein